MAVCISLRIEKLCTRIHDTSKQVKVYTERSAESFGIRKPRTLRFQLSEYRQNERQTTINN